MSEGLRDRFQEERGRELTEAFEAHRQMVLALFAATLILMVSLSIGLIVGKVSLLVTVMAAGALGGFVSALRRLYTFQQIFPNDFFTPKKKWDAYLVIYSMVPSLVGAIAAVALYLIFASELVHGDLFPRFSQSERGSDLNQFQSFVNHWSPKESTDYAKALLWGFISGFSERFVPNLLERFTSAP